ncbi:MAG: PAS domain-containing sensor histidine kinase [Chloroflexota bacterium]|nr:PAS domain-containing sensor histidine kinase [Chloroflexota bacterium]
MLAAIIAAAGDAIISTDRDGRITTWNPAAERLFGIAAADAVGHPGGLIVPGEYDAEWIRFLNQVRMASTPRTLHTKRCRQDGTLVDVAIVATTVRDPSGAVVGDVSIVRDTSEQTRAELATTELIHQLRAANHALAQLNATKSEFVATISHEFRTPLTSIQGFSELLDSAELTPDEVRTFARAINQNAIRLGRMIGDVLDLESLEAGHQQISRAPLSLNQLVVHVLNVMRALTAGHRIVTRFDPALPDIHGDTDLLERVVVNLVSNAVKYSPAGTPITLATGLRHGDVELTVADAGLGVPAEHRETIFARYGRIARPEQVGIEGTGLGLPIARHILEIHNGRIWVEPNSPTGSIFHVVLPAAIATTAEGSA